MLNILNITNSNLKVIKNKSNWNNLQLKILTISLFKLEHTTDALISFINKLIICNNIGKTLEYYEKLKNLMNEIWSMLNRQKEAFINRLYFRRPNTVIKAQFPAAVIGIGASFLAGGIVGGLIGQKIDQATIDNLNEKLTNNNNNIIVTNERINLLEENITSVFNDIKEIFVETEKEKLEKNIWEDINFNLNYLETTTNDYLKLLKIKENKLTLLRNGYLNPEMLDIKQLESAIKQGETALKNLKFPIEEISKRTIHNIIKIIEIKEIKTNRFVAIIPLVTKAKYKINTLIPLPIQLSKNKLVTIKAKNTMLMDNDKYILTSEENLEKINDNIYMIKQSEPIWRDSSKCEIAAYKRDTTTVMDICNFENIDSLENIYLSESRTKRIIFFIEEKDITIDCPGSRVIKTIVGLYTIPFECAIKTSTFSWPARQSKELKIKNVINTDEVLLNIKKLKILEINETEIINTKIKTLIDRIPEEGDKLTKEFQGISLKNIEPISAITVGIITFFLISNFIITIISFRRRSKQTTDDKLWEEELKKRMGKRIKSSRQHFRNARNSINNSIRDSIRSSYNKSKNRLRERGEHFFREKTKNVATNTNIPDTYINQNKDEVILQLY